MKKTFKIMMLLSCLSLPMAACGVKPNSVDAPQGADEDQFPHTYPSSK